MACTLSIPCPIDPLHASSPASSTIPNPAEVAESTRVLEQEIRLAARPQTYLILDLQAGQFLIKARGLELHRLALTSWTAPDPDRLAGVFYLKTRPAISRTKSGPSGDASAKPIELSDMPSTYDLPFHPPLVLSVEASSHQSAWRWLRSHAARWWSSLKRLSFSLTGTSRSIEDDHPPVISLSLADEDARSLAWTVMDGMPLLIHRQPAP